MDERVLLNSDDPLETGAGFGWTMARAFTRRTRCDAPLERVTIAEAANGRGWR
jgi:hypothetical protein